MSQAERASSTSLPSDPSHASAESVVRDSLRRSIARRAARARAAFVGRRNALAGAVALLGAMTLAVGASAAQDRNGGVSQPSRKTPSATLHPGDTGPTVVALQKALHVRADGNYGSQTRRAVRRLQRKRHMKADGIARSSVLTALGIDARAASETPAVPRVLEAIAQCESGGDPRAVSASGRYRGKYQFSVSTWRQLGGKGDPAAASEARQDRLAAKLFAQQGLSPWPHCGAQV